MHLADAFIQSNLNLILSVHAKNNPDKTTII